MKSVVIVNACLLAILATSAWSQETEKKDEESSEEQLNTAAQGYNNYGSQVYQPNEYQGGGRGGGQVASVSFDDDEGHEVRDRNRAGISRGIAGPDYNGNGIGNYYSPGAELGGQAYSPSVSGVGNGLAGAGYNAGVGGRSNAGVGPLFQGRYRSGADLGLLALQNNENSGVPTGSYGGSQVQGVPRAGYAGIGNGGYSQTPAYTTSNGGYPQALASPLAVPGYGGVGPVENFVPGGFGGPALIPGYGGNFGNGFGPVSDPRIAQAALGAYSQGPRFNPAGQGLGGNDYRGGIVPEQYRNAPYANNRFQGNGYNTRY